MVSLFVGIDIQVRRNCSYAAIDGAGKIVGSGWFSMPELESSGLMTLLSEERAFVIGIDAPRMPLPAKRQWYWNGNRRQWHKRTTQMGYGRHCETVVAAHRIANPQWTPLENETPEWMNAGFKLYAILKDLATVHEVFPTASYTLLQSVKDVEMTINFSACSPGPRDMLDAWVAAATVREFEEGRGCEVGGGDGLGTIILPRPLPEPVIHEVLDWPE